MDIQSGHEVFKESVEIKSRFLDRHVRVDFYLPTHVKNPDQMSLLLINDGQDMEELGLEALLNRLYSQGKISPLLCAGIHAGPKRKMEYATAKVADYKGRGAKAKHYSEFVLEELLSYIRTNYRVYHFKEKAFAGFSLGALSAMDIVWNHPHVFSTAGLFSGSFWWRTRDQNDKDYNDDTDRIMHLQVRHGTYIPSLRFFFECGAADEEEDRNQNGVIDSIDDTLDLIQELFKKGYDPGKNIRYLQIEDGRHDVATCSRAMPAFLEWAWGKK